MNNELEQLEKIFEKKVDKPLKQPLSFKFDLGEERFYLLIVSARAKAWWQRLPRASIRFWSDEEIEIFIDDKRIPHKINGNSLWGTRQFIIVVDKLSSGTHAINFVPQFNPFLETFSVYKILESGDIDLLQLTALRPEDTFLSSLISKSKPWILIYSAETPLLHIKIEALTKTGKQLLFLRTDDEDLQIKINDQRQINEEPKSHQYWYWCGRTLKGASKIFEASYKKEDKITLLELISDRTPQVTKFTVSFKRVPTKDDPRWTEEFEDDSEETLLARLIFGEARNQSKEAKAGVAWTVKNRLLAERSEWGFNYHEVILKPGQYAAMNPQDENFPKLIDPLNAQDPSTKKAWYESYQVAQDVIEGVTEDPTEGATFFHSADYSQEKFVTEDVPGAIFIKQINNLLFYKK